MIRLPENELELEMLVRERTEELNQYLAAVVQSSDDAIISKDLNGQDLEQRRGTSVRLHIRRGDRQIHYHSDPAGSPG